MRLTDVVQRNDTMPGRVFDWAVIVLIVVSLAAHSLATLPDLPRATLALFEVAELGVVWLFAIEYCLRVATAARKLRYIFSFYGFVDLMAFMPFLLSSGSVELYALRVVRLFIVFRLLKLTRYSGAMERFAKAIFLAKEEIVLFSVVIGVLLYLSASGIYYFEHAAQPEAFPSIVHSLWWAVSTLTTVGYGDVYPVTAVGKLFTFFILMCGLGIVAVPAGLLAASLSKVRRDEDDGTS